MEPEKAPSPAPPAPAPEYPFYDEEEEIEKPTSEMSREKRLRLLKLRSRKAEEANKKAVAKERREKVGGRDKRRREGGEEGWTAGSKKDGGDEDDWVMVTSAEHSDAWERRKKKKKSGQISGTEVFTDKAMYAAYHRRVQGMIPLEYDEKEEKDSHKLEGKDLGISSFGGSGTVAKDKVDRLVSDLQRIEKQKSAWSRRRAYYSEKDVEHISEKNRRFNEKLERSYGKYTAETKRDLERGTAL